MAVPKTKYVPRKSVGRGAVFTDGKSVTIYRGLRIVHSKTYAGWIVCDFDRPWAIGGHGFRTRTLAKQFVDRYLGSAVL